MAQVVLGELIESLVTASQGMGVKNPNKLKVMQAAEVLMHMGARIAELESEKAERDTRIVLAN